MGKVLYAGRCYDQMEWMAGACCNFSFLLLSTGRLEGVAGFSFNRSWQGEEAGLGRGAVSTIWLDWTGACCDLPLYVKTNRKRITSFFQQVLEDQVKLQSLMSIVTHDGSASSLDQHQYWGGVFGGAAWKVKSGNGKEVIDNTKNHGLNLGAKDIFCACKIGHQTVVTGVFLLVWCCWVCDGRSTV